MLTALLLVFGAGWSAGSPAVAAPTTSKAADASSPSTDVVSSTALPTAQINGVVWNQAVMGDQVIVGGSFTRARPAGSAPGQNEVTRNNLLAYSLSTGKLIDGWAPAVNGQVKNMVVSPDGKTLYVVGTFTKIGSETRNRIAAFDATTGALLPFAPNLNGPAYGVKVLGSVVYVVGGFNSANGVGRTKAAAFTTAGALTGWSPSVSGGDIRQLVISPDRTRIVFGGNFTSVDGSGKGFGLAMVGTSSAGTLYPMGINTVVRNGSTLKSGIYDVAADSTGFYGTGWGNSGTLEGAFKADWHGNLAALEDCHGDTYSIFPAGPVLYTASHAHYCANVGGFTQTDPQSHRYAMAWSNSVEGKISSDPTHYKDWTGTARPDPLAFYPDFTAGSFTGLGQATWQVTGQGDYILYGGEFTAVNGKPQQGLVRFAKRSLAPSTDAPVAPSGWAPSVKTYGGGLQRISWPAIRDRDNATVRYQLIKDGDTADPIDTTTATADFWALPSLGYLESGLKPGDKATYQVRAIDPDGNVTTSDSITSTYGYGIGINAYQRAVLGADPEYFWTASHSPVGAVASPVDLVGSGKPYVDRTVRSGSPGVLGADSSTFQFNGTNKVVGAHSEQAPNVFTVGAWFKTRSTAGGAIINMGNTQTGDSSTYNPTFKDPANPDRAIYLSPSGTVNFGVWAGGPHAVSTSKAYNDGRWHQAVATMDPDGMKLYVDGSLVGTLPTTYAGINIDGYWRVGGDKLTGWPGNPRTGYYSGDVDQVAIYRTALTAAQITDQYSAR